MSENSGSKITVIVAIIGAVGALGAALIPIVFADRTPSQIVVNAPPAPATPSTEVPAGKTAAAAKKTDAPPSDHDRFQGRWRVMTQDARAKGKITEDRDENPVWWFRGGRLIVLRMADGKRVSQFEGPFRVHPDPDGQGLIDVAHSNSQGNRFDWVGIYQLEGDVLKVCYRVRRVPDDPPPDRPTAFVLSGEMLSFNVRLKRVGASN